MKSSRKFFKPVLIAITCLMTAGMASAQGITMATWGGGVGKGWREAFGKPFTAAKGYPVTIVEVPSPEAQIRAQKDAPKYNAAIASLFEAVQMYDDGLLEDFDPKDIPALKDVPEKFLLKTPAGRVVGVSTYFAYYGIAVNTDLAKSSDFSSWKELGNPKWKGKLAITRPVYSSAYDLTILSVASGGTEKDPAKGLPLLSALAGNSLAMYSSMAQMNQLLQRGEVVAAPYYSTRVWEMRREGMKNLQMVTPKEGGLSIPYLVVVPKGATGKNEYMQWLNYVAQPEGQIRLAELAGYMPLNSTAVLPPALEKELGQPLPALLQSLYQPDWMLIARTRKDRMSMVEKAMANAPK